MHGPWTELRLPARAPHIPSAGLAPPLETQSQRGAVSPQVTRGPHTYSVGVCTAAAGLDEGGCKDGAVCLLSGSKGASFGRLASMKLDYRHQDEAVILSYANGDTCPPGKSLWAGGVSVPSRQGIRHGSRRELRNGAPDAMSLAIPWTLAHQAPLSLGFPRSFARNPSRQYSCPLGSCLALRALQGA